MIDATLFVARITIRDPPTTNHDQRANGYIQIETENRLGRIQSRGSSFGAGNYGMCGRAFGVFRM